MVTEIEFLFSLGVLLPTAVALSLLFARIKLPIVPAQIFAGMALGPAGLAVLSGLETLNLLASLGIVFLMFFLGLELDPSELRKMGFRVIALAILETSIASAIGFVLGLALGFTWITSLFIAFILGVTSTAIVGRILLERGRLRDELGHMVMGLLIVEDVLAIFLILLLPKLALFGKIEAEAVLAFLFQGVILFALIVVFDLLVAPRLIDFLSQFEVEFSEITLLSAVSLGIFFSYVSALLGFSPAIGAFLTGLMVRGKQSKFLSAKVVPVKDLFTVLFFVSMGTLIRPQSLVDQSIVLLVLGTGAVAGKMIAGWLITHMGKIGVSSIELGLTLTPRGEFSLVLAIVAINAGIVDPLISIAGGLTILTVLVSALGLRGISTRVGREEYRLRGEIDK